ncbi:MAG: Eco47II family restriction endonuclease [Pseudoleptotrichia goodfellowii]|nr:Eco47II family restriction endonuclease [Pseudoleptotrichia goodfellowii]
MKYKSIELFAGAGGLALGLEQAGFKHIGLIEFDKNAAQTLIDNRPNWNVLLEDVENVSKRDLENEFQIKKYELDLLSGGAPCQSFSYAGKRMGLEDTRGTMFYHYATFLHKLQPKIFLFENVRGLLSHDKGKTFETIVKIFEEEGYNISYKILNAWDYGVAQKRERLIIIGIRKDLSGKVKFEFPKKDNYKPVLRDVLINVPESEGAKYTKSKAEIFSLVPAGGYWRDIDPNVAKEYMKSCWYMEGGRTGILRRLSMDEPSLTILTTPQMKQTDRCHPLEVRPFNIRESARIQSFPDEWEFSGNLSSKYKQIGNAVPVNLAKKIGEEIIKVLELIEMTDNYILDFIKQSDFENHVIKTLKEYRETLKAIDLKKFNSNLIDPIKLLFDKNAFNKTYREIIDLEIQRQRDKSNNNSIGYFHQKIFRYIKGCKVPSEGWDIIFTPQTGETIYVELKNKHNTMNSASATNTYIKFQSHLLNSEDRNNSVCALVEVIAKKSQNTPWTPTVNKVKQPTNEKLRRISIDKFYECVTGDKMAFRKICTQLPITIEKVINKDLEVEDDTVFSELEKIDKDILTALYKLAFSEYEGFNFHEENLFSCNCF